MAIYLSLLRGINVSGKNKIRMADLKALYEKLGFSRVNTYIQSGNVIFEATLADEEKLARIIEHTIHQAYGFDVPVLIRNAEALQSLVSSNPFLKEDGVNPEKLHLTFLKSLPLPEDLEKLQDIHYPPDRYEVIGKDIYIHCPERYGKTKLSNSFFERKLKTKATTRNWKTLNKLIDLARMR